MDKKPMYFQLEPGAFLSDMDFQVMTAEQRGVYCTLIFYLYLNDGKLKHDMPLLSKICNVNSGFDFKDVLGKFQIHRGFIYHKRVTSEFTRSSDRMKIEQEWKSKSSQGGIRSARIKKAREIGTHTALEWQYLVCEAGNICPRCEKFTDQFTKDHVQPIYQNGSDAITNIQPLCSGCNSAKGSDSTDFFQVQREQALRNLYNSGMVPRVVEPPLVTIREGKKRKGKVSKEKNNNPLTVPPKKKLFVPPTVEDVKEYIRQNPELNNIDPIDFWKGYDDGEWIDTQGKPVRNWKLKLRTRSNFARQNAQSGGGRIQEASLRPQKPRKNRDFPVPSPEDPNYVEG